MRSWISGAIAIVMAGWIVAIAIISIQNVFITNDSGEQVLVSLKFLGFTSVSLPFGFILTLSAAIGMVATALIWPLMRLSFPSKRRLTNRRSTPRR